MSKKILFINQEITPYVPETEMSLMGYNVPLNIQEAGYEIRTFMPKWGNINERRGQLHEVIPTDHKGGVYSFDKNSGVFH